MAGLADVDEQKKINDCRRFFGYGKKIPKDVKRHCGICRQHGIVVETRKHLCQFKDCDCWKCDLVRKRRSIMSTQIRLRREQDKKFQRTTDESEADIVPWNTEKKEKKEEINLCYFCQKCKNHGVLMWKKDHKKNCEYADCRCVQCDLIDTRRALDRHIKKNKSQPSLSDSTNSSEASSVNSPDSSDGNRQGTCLQAANYVGHSIGTTDISIPATVSPSPTMPSSFGLLNAHQDVPSILVAPTVSTYPSMCNGVPIITPNLLTNLYTYHSIPASFPFYSTSLISPSSNLFQNVSMFDLQTMLASFVNMKQT